MGNIEDRVGTLIKFKDDKHNPIVVLEDVDKVWEMVKDPCISVTELRHYVRKGSGGLGVPADQIAEEYHYDPDFGRSYMTDTILSFEKFKIKFKNKKDEEK